MTAEALRWLGTKDSMGNTSHAELEDSSNCGDAEGGAAREVRSMMCHSHGQTDRESLGKRSV